MSSSSIPFYAAAVAAITVLVAVVVVVTVNVDFTIKKRFNPTHQNFINNFAKSVFKDVGGLCSCASKYGSMQDTH